ncbi:hypothetical protein IJI55_03455 [Candidatus Saccharibacteria bacterium]|nr:hypothetical protein [Candidatus Saccharibacteria bacterium]MBR3323755.1 hypothetical protein [Candidatus Saccharibacteria bacterium]
MEQKKQTLAVDMDNVIVRPKEIEPGKSDNAYAGVALLPGCKDVLAKLNRKYDLYIVTSFLWKDHQESIGDNLKNKYEFLISELPFITPEQIIFTCHKNNMDFDVRIDDNPDNLENGKIKLLFDSPKNQSAHPEDLLRLRIIRVNNWREIDKTLV